MEVSTRLQGISEYYFSQKMREIEQLNQSGEAVINLGIGSPDLPPHPQVVAALNQSASLDSTHAYQSYKGSPILRQAIAQWYQRYYAVQVNPETEILPLIGSKEGIVHICMTYLNPGDHALIPDPGYPTYASAVKLTGAVPVTYDLLESNGWKPNWDALLVQVQTYRPKLIFVNYPHMPTGQTPDAGFFHQLVAFARTHDLLIVHDNPYSFILNDEPASLLSVPGALDVVLELNSLSKSHNMAGWRLGMLLASSQRIQDVLRFKSNMDSGMFLPIQMAAAAALSLDATWYQQLNETYRQRRKEVYALFDAMGCSYQMQQVGLFVWAKVPDGYVDGYALSDTLLTKARVFITPGGIFGSNGNRFIRISLCAKQTTIQQARERISEQKIFTTHE
jgi:aspartate/methionine/tyrosine aminotransferase